MELERLNAIKRKLDDRKLKYSDKMTLFHYKVCLRYTEETVIRMVISAIMAKCTFDLYYESERADEIIDKAKRELKRFGVLCQLFPEEKNILTKNYDESLILAISWRYESARSLMWALGLVKSIDDAYFPDDVKAEVKKTYDSVMKYKNINELLSMCKMRNEDELADMFQTYWYYHWNIHDGWFHKKDIETVSWDVVVERRLALQWLVYSEIDENNSWHNIPLDT